MTNIEKWAEHECMLARKKENPDYNGNDFDYGCSCYESALKAFRVLANDGHSGCSFNITKNILSRLMNCLPLTAITDNDFFTVERGTETYPLESEESLRERGLKSHYQCPRMPSLFREETLDGQIKYHDIDRAYYIDIEDPSDTYSSWDGFLDDMFPITMPYYPTTEKYKIYAQTFLTDKNNGDFDTKGILYIITPEGKKIDINIYMTEKNGKMVNITKEEYNELLKNRIDKLNEKIAYRLMWTLISNSANDNEIELRERLYKEFDKKEKNKKIKQLNKLCKFFCKPKNYKYNVFEVHQDLCTNNIEKYKEIPELINIGEFLKDFLETLKNKVL